MTPHLLQNHLQIPGADNKTIPDLSPPYIKSAINTLFLCLVGLLPLLVLMIVVVVVVVVVVFVVMVMRVVVVLLLLAVGLVLVVTHCEGWLCQQSDIISNSKDTTRPPASRQVLNCPTSLVQASNAASASTAAGQHHYTASPNIGRMLESAVINTYSQDNAAGKSTSHHMDIAT